MILISVVSMGGSNEFVECFWGAVAEGSSGVVVEVVGDGVEVGLVAGDGGSFRKVSADKPVGVFVDSSLPGLTKPHQVHHPSTPRNRRIQIPTTPPIMKSWLLDMNSIPQLI